VLRSQADKGTSATLVLPLTDFAVASPPMQSLQQKYTKSAA